MARLPLVQRRELVVPRRWRVDSPAPIPRYWLQGVSLLRKATRSVSYTHLDVYKRQELTVAVPVTLHLVLYYLQMF